MGGIEGRKELGVQPLELTLLRVVIRFWIILVMLLPLGRIRAPSCVVITQNISYE